MWWLPIVVTTLLLLPVTCPSEGPLSGHEDPDSTWELWSEMSTVSSSSKLPSKQENNNPPLLLPPSTGSPSMSTSTFDHSQRPESWGEVLPKDESHHNGPVISSIRHYKSRKSFQRTRKSPKPISPTTILGLLSGSSSEEMQGDEPSANHDYSSSLAPDRKKQLYFTSWRLTTTPSPPLRLRQSAEERGGRAGDELVYGKPQLTARKQNSTKMQRIKVFLNKTAISAPPGTDHNPTADTGVVSNNGPSGKTTSDTRLVSTTRSPRVKSGRRSKSRSTTTTTATTFKPGTISDTPQTTPNTSPEELVALGRSSESFMPGPKEEKEAVLDSSLYELRPELLLKPASRASNLLGHVETAPILRKDDMFPDTDLGDDLPGNKTHEELNLSIDYASLGRDEDMVSVRGAPETLDGDRGEMGVKEGGGEDEDESEDEELRSVLPTASSSSTKTKPDIDIVTKFLRIVETQHTLGDNCTAGTAFSLGEGVVDRYAQERFRLEANVAVNRANMLTRLWKYAEPRVLESEYLLHANLFSMIEFDDDIFAAGNCYDKLQYKNYTLFCPYAYRLPEGSILVKDLAVEYKYLSNTSEWFFIARNNAERVIKNYNQFSRGFNSYAYNESTHTDRVKDEILNVTYEDGKWSKPYFDCGGGNIWMMTYTVPFFGYHDGHYFFKGTSGIDIDLRRVDIDQCPLPENSTELNIFAASDKCKNSTTKCVPIKGLGFRRGSYRCECQGGYYFPNTSSPIKYFNGTVLEEEYEKRLMNEKTDYDENGAFECIRCLEGCDTCIDDRPCVVTLNWLMRSAIVILQCAIIAMLPIVGLFTWKYSDIKVVRAASPVLLRFIVLGAFFIYCTILVMYPSPSLITCTLRVWLREIGFSLAYGALMLKTWRISVIFRVRSAKAVKITDLDLMKRLGIIVAMFAALLVIRTLVAPPVAIVSLTADDLKAWLCQTDWWDHSFTFMELILLVWGIRLCIVVRKAPSEFNESKFISLAIYNEFLLSVFLNISMLFLQSPANPDLLYIIFFCHVQLTMTLLLCLIFGSKAYMVFRGHGKGNSSDETRVPTFISKNRSGQKPKQPSGQNSTTGVHSSTTSTSHAHDPNFNSRLSEDVQDEFRRLYYQLEELKERNMRLGNRHLVAKITAMQEAADSILSAAPPSNCLIHPHAHQQQQQHHHAHSASSSSGGGAGDKGTSDGGHDNSDLSTPNVLSDITEETEAGGGGPGSKPPKSKKRQSFFNRVKSTKRLMSLRSKSAKESNRVTKAHKSATSHDESSKASDSQPPQEDEDPEDKTLIAHGGVYIGDVRPNPPGNKTSSPPEKTSAPRESRVPGRSCETVEAQVETHETPPPICDVDNVDVMKETEEVVLPDYCDFDPPTSPHPDHVTQESIPMTELSKLRSPKQSQEKGNHGEDSKILLDLNDKSRFTEEITV